MSENMEIKKLDREIKFRGKDVHGNWRFGSLMSDGYITEIIENVYTPECQYHRVDPTTVGQYTGLKDMDDKEIYEGDIVEIISYCTQPRDEVLTKTKADVVFRKGSFVARRASAVYCIANYLGYVQVIGNIHDNPELMKGGEG